MTGFHGKNVEIRVSTSETVLSGAATTVVSGTATQYEVAVGSRDWKYDKDRTSVDFTDGDSVAQSINTQTRFINYAGGAAELGHFVQAVSSVTATAVSMELNLAANLVGCARNFTLAVRSDTIDTTCIGESWKTFADGLQGFEGNLDGMWIDEYWYKQAVATLSGVIPQRVLRFMMNPANDDTYYQGTCIFPEWEVTGGVDAAIEDSVPFQGRGPLDLILNDTPYFNLAEVF